MSTLLNGSFVAGDLIEPQHITQLIAPLQDLEEGQAFYRDDIGAANAYKVNFDGTGSGNKNRISTYRKGQLIVFKALNANTGAATLQVVGPSGLLPAMPLVKPGNIALSGNDIKANQMVAVVFNDADTGRFEMVGAPGSGGMSAPGGPNTFYGENAGASLTTGQNNTGIGYRALYSNLTGWGLVALGYQALRENTASENTAVGYLAGVGNTSGMCNSSFGAQAGYINAIGNYNTFLGYNAGLNAVADSNTFVGFRAGYSATTSPSNVCLGHYAGDNLTTGAGFNIVVGAGVDAPSATGTNQINIGDCLKRSSGAKVSQLAPSPFAVAANSVETIAPRSFKGLLVLSSDSDNSCCVYVAQGNANPSILSNPSGTWTASNPAASSSTYGVYDDGTNLVFENAFAVSKTIKIALLGA